MNPLLQKIINLLIYFLLIASITGTLFAQIEERNFDTAEQVTLYKKMISELRCLVCQNQNLADSNAALAQDLRQKTYNMIKAGDTYQDIIDFMTLRYGDFILYNPPLNANTLLLWLTPFILLILIIVYVFFFKKSPKDKHTLSQDDLDKAEELLKEHKC